LLTLSGSSTTAYADSEIGERLDTPAHEARRQQNIDLIDRYEQAHKTAIAMADEKGITVDPANEEWDELWENYKKELNLPEYKMFITFP